MSTDGVVEIKCLLLFAAPEPTDAPDVFEILIRDNSHCIRSTRLRSREFAELISGIRRNPRLANAVGITAAKRRVCQKQTQ